MKKACVMVYYKSDNTEGYRMRIVKYWFWNSKSLAIARKIKEITEGFPINHAVTGIKIF